LIAPNYGRHPLDAVNLQEVYGRMRDVTR